MLKALITAAVLATSVASASAYSDASDQPPRTPAGKAATAAQASHMKLQPGGADTVKVRAVYSPVVRPNPSTDEFDTDESGWRSYGMLLATLVLMGVIAVRRYKAGRP